MNAGREYVFGYGSLAAEAERGHIATLRGRRRCWGVAMDNRADLPGYKSYRLRSDGSRPAVFVAFLDIEAAAGCTVTGLCLPVGERDLAALDRRERNYERIDVTAAIAKPPGRIWAYSGSAAGRARLLGARADDGAVVSRDYLRGVQAAIAAIAPEELKAVWPDAAALRVLDLERVEIP